MVRYPVLLLSLTPLLLASHIPAGANIEIRLTTTIDSTTTKSGQPVNAVVIAPVVVGNSVALGAGVKVLGHVREAKSPETLKDQAILILAFDKLQDPAGATAPLTARVAAVDNARETVDEDGRILGIVAAETGSARLDQGINKLADRYPGLAGILGAAKQSVVSEADPSIKYPAGVEMTIVITKPLDWTGKSTLPDVGSIAPAAGLERLVNRQPFLTEAVKPAKPSDVTNLMFLGTEESLTAAFKEAGWMPAQRLNGESKLETFRAIVEQRGYQEAPVSTILLDGRAPDLVFEKLTNTFNARHHLRVWRRPDLFNGRQVWVCAATHDIGIDFSEQDHTFIHKIDSHIDLARAKVVNDLLFTGRVTALSLVARPEVPTSGYNATGDQFLTDGAMAVLQF